jgi:glycosyltransferase involved in cell wall biosynthesis
MQYTLIQSILTEDKPELSIILPSIRVSRLPNVYESIQKSTRRSFELVIVGPYDVPEELKAKRNVKYARDWGSPMRASNIGAEMCEGKIITWNSDDTLFLPDAIDVALDTLYAMGPDDKNTVIAKYYEGAGYSGTDAHGDDYYKLCNAYPRSPHIPVEWWIFNAAFVYRTFFEKLGAWDCRYQACPLGHADFGVRAQRAGAIVKMSPVVLATSDHLGPGEGDHVPIEIVQSTEDDAVYRNHYSVPLENHPICIDVSNWKKSPAIWRKRFQ